MTCWLLALVSLGIGAVEDFDAYRIGAFQKGRLDSWRWSDERREQFHAASRLEIVNASPEPGRLLRVEVRDPAVLADEALPIVRLAPHFPPEADVLRVRLKVVSGQTRIYAGGPTAYYANSDVFTAVHVVKADDPAEWQTIELGLNHPLWRNFRRAGVSTDAPRNYYNRWAQEPFTVYLATGSEGEFFIDWIDIASRGEGRPFPQFPFDRVRTVRTIADFEDGGLDAVFNWYMANDEIEWFEESWRRTRPLRFTPALLSVTEAGQPGRKALTCTGATAEEVHGTAIRTTGAADANALRVTLAAEAPGESNTLVGMGPAVPIDFLVFVAAPMKGFAWESFGPADSLRTGPGPGFDVQLSSRVIRSRSDVSFAIYQTRRFLPPQTWTTLILPAADFTCIYGHGADRPRFTNHEPLTLGDVVAVGWLNPWCRSGRRGPTAATRIDEIAYVHVPGTAAEHRSYWQIPATSAVRMIDDRSQARPIRWMALPGETHAVQDPR